MLSFFTKQAKTPTDPLASEQAAKDYIDQLKHEHGALAHERVLEVLRTAKQTNNRPLLEHVKAVLLLNQETHALHEALCQQYLMNTRMPKVIEQPLRKQILAYGQSFIQYYQMLLPKLSPLLVDTPQANPLLTLLTARTLYYLCEQARWQLLKNRQPETALWQQLNQLYTFAEQHDIATQSVSLFNENPSRSVQSHYINLHMLSLLSNGRLRMKQLNTTYELLHLLSTELTLSSTYSQQASYSLCLSQAQGACRAQTEVTPDVMTRYWSTQTVVSKLQAWEQQLISGQLPDELQPLVELGLDRTLLSILCQEWAPQTTPVIRAERLRSTKRVIDATYRLTTLHRVIRGPEDNTLTKRGPSNAGFADAINLRIYGYITPSKPIPTPNVTSVTTAPLPITEVLQKWQVDNISQSGLGVNLDAAGNDWLDLGELIGFFDEVNRSWCLGVVRRLKHPTPARLYLGIETLSRQVVAASLRPIESYFLAANLPAEQVWLSGHIALFMPYQRNGQVLNTIILPLAAYSRHQSFYLQAKSRQFPVVLGDILKQGRDWCLVEVELNNTGT